MLFVHLGGMALLMFVPIGWTIRIVAGGLMGWSLYRSLCAHALRQGPLAITAIELDSEGVAALRFAENETWHSAQIVSRFVHPWVTLMALRVESRRWPVNLVIAVDAVEPESFRRWRVALKLR